MISGIEVFHDDGSVQINSDFQSFAYSGRKSLTAPPGISTHTITHQGTAGTVYAVRSPVAWIGNTKAEFDFQNNWHLDFETSNPTGSPATVDLFFFEVGLVVPVNHGLEIYTAEGKLAFSSATIPFTILETPVSGCAVLMQNWGFFGGVDGSFDALKMRNPGGTVEFNPPVEDLPTWPIYAAPDYLHVGTENLT